MKGDVMGFFDRLANGYDRFADKYLGLKPSDNRDVCTRVMDEAYRLANWRRISVTDEGVHIGYRYSANTTGGVNLRIDGITLTADHVVIAEGPTVSTLLAHIEPITVRNENAHRAESDRRSQIRAEQQRKDALERLRKKL